MTMKRISNESRVWIGFLIALIFMLFAGLKMYQSLREYIDTGKLVAHTHLVLDELDIVSTRMREIESSQRAFLITNDSVFLEEQDKDTKLITQSIEQLKLLTQDNPRQQERLDELTRLIGIHLTLLETTLAVNQDIGFEAARERIQLGISRRGMDQVQKLIADLSTDERTLLTQRTTQAEKNANFTLTLGSGLYLLAIIGLCILWLRARAQTRTQKTSEAAIYQSVLLSQVLDLLPVGVILSDAKGQHTSINPSALKIWEVPPSKYMFQNDALGAWQKDSDIVLSPSQWGLARTFDTGETIRDELIDIRCFNGERKTVRTYSTIIHNEQGLATSGLLVFVDVTEFQRKEKYLTTSALFDETQASMLSLFSDSFDKQKISIDFLKLLAARHPIPASALYIFDARTDHFTCIAGHGLSVTVPTDFILGEGILGEAARQNKSIALDSSTLKIETGLIDFQPKQVLIFPMSYQDRRIAVLVLATTEMIAPLERAFLDRLMVTLGVALDNLHQYNNLQQLASQLKKSSDEISEKNLLLEDASRMKSEFLANMSHELRTPLNAIIGFSEVLKDGLLGELQPKQKEYISDIFKSGGHLLSLINDILDLSKVEAGKMSLDLEASHVESLLDAGIQIIREKANAHRLHITTHIAPSIGDLWLDQRKTKQIIYNLLSNAVKFTSDGGNITMTAQLIDPPLSTVASIIDRKDEAFSQFLEISIQDNGIGISSEDQKRLFQPFVQIDSALARKYEGTGLGLAMVKRLTELHGGRVTLESQPGKGSTFSVLLPARRAPTQITLSNQTSHA